MTQEYIPGEQIPAEKVYKDKEVWVAAYLGGPLTAGYLIAENYKAFGEKEKARRAWVIGAAILAAVVVGVYFVPYVERIPSLFFALLYAGAGYSLLRILQGEKIRAHVRAGGAVHSWYRTLAVSVIGLAISAVPFLAVGYTLYAIDLTKETSKTYGRMKNEIGFNTGNIAETEIDRIAEGFRETTFFDDEYQKFVYVRKEKNDYEFYFAFDRTILEDLESLKPYENLRDEMQKLFPNERVVFKMTVDSYENVVRRMDGTADKTPKITKIQ